MFQELIFNRFIVIKPLFSFFRITGNKTDVALEYLPLLKHALTKPLLESEQDGVKDVLQIMENYYLLREDFDSILDLSLWPEQVDPRTKISPKVSKYFTDSVCFNQILNIFCDIAHSQCY